MNHVRLALSKARKFFALPFVKRWALWFIVVGIPFVLVWRNFEELPKSDTRDQFLGNFLATVLGALFGIPIALEISRYQQRSQQQQKEVDERTERASRKSRILELIKNELIFNDAILTGLIAEQSSNSKTRSIAGMKFDLWSSLSESGELHWLDDLNALDALAEAYHYIRRISILEEHYSDSGFNMSVSTSAGNTFAGAETAWLVCHLRPIALTAVQKALRVIGWTGPFASLALAPAPPAMMTGAP